MTKRVLIMLVALGLGVGCVGCYRAPTDPTRLRQNAEARRDAAEPAVPKDALSTPSADAQDATVMSREVVVGTHRLTAPDQWVRKPLTSPFLLAEFALPKVEGDTDDGRLTVSTAGGTVENNLDRWKGQFGGTPESASEEVVEVGGIQVTWVDYAGTFTDQRGAMAEVTPKPGYRMLAAIIPLGDQLFFIKGYGPQKTVAAYADQIRLFLQSLQPNATVESTPSLPGDVDR